MDPHQLIVAFPALVVSIIALCASIYICLSVLMMKRLRERQEICRQEISRTGNFSALTLSMQNVNSLNDGIFYAKPLIFEYYIFWMSICDGLAVIGRMFVLSPWLLDSQFMKRNPNICKFIGGWCQFFYVGGCLWYLWIAIMLFKLMFGLNLVTTKYTAKKTKYLHTFLTWSITIILTVIPIIGNSYGSIDDEKYLECWIHSSHYSYMFTLYATVMITNLAALFLLFSFLIMKCTEKGWCHNVKISEKLIKRKKRKQNKHPHLDDRYSLNDVSYTDDSLSGSIAESVTVYELNKRNRCCTCCCFLCDDNRYFGVDGIQSEQDRDIANQVIKFSLAYICVWSIPIALRIRELFFGPLTIWEISVHDLFLSSIGIFNAIVWSSSKNYISYNKIKQVLAEDEEEQQKAQFSKKRNVWDVSL